MKGLLIKDFYTLIKQLGIFVLIIICFTVIPGYNFSIIAIVYATMLPITAISYDERSKWEQLAVMMPYKTNTVVFEKYLLGYIAAFGATLLSASAQFIMTVSGLSKTGMSGISYIVMLCVALLYLAVVMPPLYALGVEKGRIVFLILIGGGVSAICFLMGDSSELFTNIANFRQYFALLPIGVVLLSVLSIFLSMKFYKHRIRK